MTILEISNSYIITSLHMGSSIYLSIEGDKMEYSFSHSFLAMVEIGINLDILNIKSMSFWKDTSLVYIISLI